MTRSRFRPQRKGHGQEALPAEPRVTRWVLLALLTGSLAAMLFEIELTRLFSFLFSYQYVFAVVALAVAGLAAGAILAQRFRPAESGRLLLYVERVTALNATIILAFVLLVRVAASLNEIWLYAVVAIIIYGLWGFNLSLAFGLFATGSGRLYFADLTGAGLGCLLVIPIISWIGVTSALCLVGCLVGGSALLWRIAAGRRMAWRSAPVPLLALAFLLLNLASGVLEPDVRTIGGDKFLFQTLQNAQGQARIVFSQWDAFGRTDVLETQAEPHQKYVLIDGASAAAMLAPPADLAELQEIRQSIDMLPLLAIQPERTLIIGPGGGRDILFAVLAGSKEVTAVEVNPGAVAAGRYFANFNGSIFDYQDSTAKVHTFVDEGRSFLRRDPSTYDIIYLSLVATRSAEQSGLMLAENYVYTVEAFKDYFAHLNPRGAVIQVLYDEPTLFRAMATAVQALREMGESEQDAMRHIEAYYDPALRTAEGDPLAYPVLVVKRETFPDSDVQRDVMGIQSLGYRMVFAPSAPASGQFLQVLSGQTTLALAVNTAGRNYAPTRDDSPFFFQYQAGLPEPLSYVLLVVVGLGVVGIVYLFGRRKSYGSGLWRFVAYFSLLGAGFMLLELSLLQKLSLFLGHPTLAVTVTLAVLLLAGGIGSGFSQRWSGASTIRAARLAALGCALVALAYVWVLPWVTNMLLGLEQALRVVTAVALLAPIGFLMGMPFPLGLRLLQSKMGVGAISMAWGANGLMSALGATGTTAIAILLGFGWALGLGALIYACATILLTLGIWEATPVA